MDSVDPLGLSRLTIHYATGRLKIYENPTANDLLEALYSSPGKSIKKLQPSGHGSVRSQCTSPGSSCSDDISPNLDIFAGHKKVANITNILKEKLADSGSIHLEGCNNASGDENIAQSISKILEGTPVVGGNGYQLGYENHWLFGNSSGSIGLKKMYINGIVR